MVTLFVRHVVADYRAWRRVLDDNLPARKQAGVLAESVFQSVDDPNDITLALEFRTLEAARAFPDNEKLKAALHAAGVVGTPTEWFATKV